MDESKSKVTLYVRPELHKLLKLRSVHLEMKMSELAERMFERYLLEISEEDPIVCPNCKLEFVPDPKMERFSKLPVGST